VYNIWIKADYGIVLTEEMLESFNIPNLGYIKTKHGFQVFDTTKEEYVEEQFPVYVNVLGDIKKTNKWILFKTPTTESVNASKAIYQQIENEIIKLCYNESFQKVIKLLEEGNGIAYINTETNSIYDLFSVLHKGGIKTLFASNGKYIIGKVAKKPVLDLYVPESIIARIIGKGGENIKKITAEIKAKRINVKPIKD